MVTCWNCGTANDESATFCVNPACGVYLSWSTEPASSDSPEVAWRDGAGGRPAGEGPKPAPGRRRRAATEREPAGAESPGMRLRHRSTLAPVEEPSEAARPRTGVALSMDPTDLRVEPGGEASREVRVRNTGQVVDQFALRVTGEPAAWAILEPASLNLYPEGEPEAVRVRFLPPRSSAIASKRMPFMVEAVSQEDPRTAAVAQGALDVAPYYDFFGQLVPHMTRGRFATQHELVLHNRGNTAINASLEAADPNKALAFTITPPTLVPEPGRQAGAAVDVRPRKRLWIGTPRVHPFQVSAAASGAGSVAEDAQMWQLPIIPRWVLVLVILLLLPIALLIAYFLLTAKVPNVVGQPYRQARAQLLESGFGVAQVKQASDDPDLAVGEVIRTDPQAGVRKRKGTVVTVESARGVQVPNVINQDADAARERLTQSGFFVEQVEKPDQAPAGKVVKTVPEPKTEVKPGSTVVVHVSSGPAPAAVAMSPASLSLPGQPVGSPAPPRTVDINNSGGAQLTVTAISLAGANAGDFALGKDACSGTTLSPEAACALEVIFTPAAAGPRTAELRIASDAPGSPQVMPIEGVGLSGSVTVVPATLEYSSQKVGTTSAPGAFRLTNGGNSPLTIQALELTGANKGDFAAAGESCTAAKIAPGGDCSIEVVFKPSSRGTRSASLVVTTDAQPTPRQTIALTGVGAAPIPRATPAGLVFDDVIGMQQTVIISNAGDASLIFRSVVIASGPDDAQGAQKFTIDSTTCDAGVELRPGETCSVTVERAASTLAGCHYADLVIEHDGSRYHVPIRRALLC